MTDVFFDIESYDPAERFGPPSARITLPMLLDGKLVYYQMDRQLWERTCAVTAEARRRWTRHQRRGLVLGLIGSTAILALIICSFL